MLSSEKSAPSNSGVWWIEPVGHGSLHSPQYMHFAMSMSKRVMTRPPAALSFSASITMQSIGQARSHARQAVQISRSTSRMPR